MFGIDPISMIITMVTTGIGMLISGRLKSKFEQYSQVPMQNGMSGRDVAERMLRDNGITDVQVVSVPGFLSDHYNPMNKTVNLSPDVFEGRSVAAAAVAAHECGHAVQHATAYSMLQFRSAIVPMVNIASMGATYLTSFAFMMLASSSSSLGRTLLLVGILAFAVTTLFSLVTLPVEFDASNRALAWLERANITSGEEHTGAKDALWWAAMTYVSAAMASLVQLVYLIMRYRASGNRG
jgi:uncharacterized protein